MKDLLMLPHADPFSFSSSTFSPTHLTEVPESLRAFAEQGIAQARDGYQKFKDAAESSTGAMEAACHSAAKGASEYTVKLIEMTKTNTDAAFNFAQSLLGAHSMSDAFELMNNHARQQFELLTAQSRDLAELGQKMAEEAVEPIKASVAKASAAKAFKPGM
jgi:phasin